jgi:hypothetical protein
MAWPTPQDYNEAVQNPRLTFADPELQMGCPELTQLGLPRAITGNFASVYKFHCHQRIWAVRCFLRSFHDYERRYAAISDHLSRLRLPYTVGFTFFRNGIKVRGQWYPILKMEWVQGEPLNAFIANHLGDHRTLLSLARQWVDMVKALQQASIAHGDLQHGNVLVVHGQLRLIDYDGMYVPALSGERSHELGHRNYQHPLRTESDFGPYLDNFSAWVVYLSLIALAADPSLWEQFGGGDECLLFRREDFEEPEVSNVLRALQRHRDQRIQSAIALFKSLLYLAPRDVPSLDGQIPPIGIPGDTTHTDGGHRGADWIEDYINAPPNGSSQQGQLPQSPGGFPPATSFHGSWILDFLEPRPTTPVAFKNPVALERFLLVLSAIQLALLPGAISGLAFWLLDTLLLTFLNLTLWIYRFRRDSSVREAKHLKRNLKDLTDSIRTTECALETLNREKTKLQSATAAEQARLLKEQELLAATERQLIDARQAALQAALSSITTRRRMLNQEQAAALQRVNNKIGARVADLNRRIADLNQAETAELNRALHTKQHDHITAYLRLFRLDQAAIRRIPPAVHKRLIHSGFITAADVDFYRVQAVPGIGPRRAQALADWRSSLEAQARRTMPSALSHTEAAAIRAKYERERLALEHQRDLEVHRQRREEDNIRATYRHLLEQLDEEAKAEKARAETAITEIRARCAQQYHAIRESQGKLLHDTTSKLRHIDAKIGEARRTLFVLHWRKAQLRRQLSAYAGIHFQKYVKRLFVG